MKRIIIILTVTFTVVSCKDFLDLREQGTLPSTGIDYTKPENIFMPVSNIYAQLRNFGVSALPYIAAFEITSDNADKGSTPEDNPPTREMDNFTYGTNHEFLNLLWVDYYNIISAANNAIAQMPLFEEAQTEESNRAYARQCAGEAKALRAWAYFNLVRLFGRVPIVDRIMTASELAELPQATITELYAFIEHDLNDAIAVMPESYSKSWAGRLTRFSAMGILAKVCLYEEKWDDVAHLTDEIIASGRYDLLASFREVFAVEGENSRESLFEVQSSTLGKASGEAPYSEYAYVQGPRDNQPTNMQGWGFCVPSQDLIDFFTARNDNIRAAATLLYRGTKTIEGDSIKTRCTNPVYNGKVYTPSTYNIWSSNGYGFEHNIRLLRYSDILLMFAEAKMHGTAEGMTSGYTADMAVNRVRERAGLMPLSGVTLQEIWDERRAELALEEDRFFDLIRTGQAAVVLAGKGFVTGKNELFPIPEAQRRLNSNLMQNPGY